MQRLIAQLALAAAAAPLLVPVAAQAQAWPAGKPVQVIVPAPGGGGTGDTIARVLVEGLAKRMGTTMVVDNKAGANGNIGAAAAAQAAPDGYRLLFSWAGTLAVNPSLYRNLPFDPQRSFEPIALVAEVPNILVVNNDLPAKNVTEFVRYAKEHPGKLAVGSTGQGSSMHLALELFMRETGTKMLHVPYNAPGLATTNLIANDIQAMFQLIPGVIGQVKGAKVRALGVMSAARSPALPEVPTMAEQGFPKLMSTTWFALLAPKGTPAAILDKLNAETNEVLRDPEVRKKLADMGATTLGGTRQALAEHLAAETTKWKHVVQDANIQLQ
ncbi:MAG: ABC transporter substrate-binding protein [Pseudomonadota bacterium]|nr:tripartite tricarboxylate transporter substrate binding protein [Rubrivivax sp.]